MARRRRRTLNFNPRRGSGRFLALLAILFVLALTSAPPVKHYFNQRAQINALQSQLDANSAALAKARQELTLWQDPQYIKSQARERLHFVLPGERQYIVTGGANQSSESDTRKVADSAPDGQPWYTRLIVTITEAG